MEPGHEDRENPPTPVGAVGGEPPAMAGLHRGDIAPGEDALSSDHPVVPVINRAKALVVDRVFDLPAE